jgi:pimeloyl-ACP methyl ester carboxylesterase
MKRAIAFGLLAGTAALIAAGPTAAQTREVPAALPKAAKVGRVEVNGVNYYYEIHGTGEPLLLLHGGLGSIDMFRPIMPKLAEHRQVIAVDLQGHGRTPLGRPTISPVDIGNDMSQLLTKLGYKQVDVFGYSFGGATAIRLAIQHPEKVRRLALLSTPFAQSGFYPEMLPQQAAVGAAMADAMKQTPMYQSYMSVAPDPKEFPKLLDAMGAMMRQPYDWSDNVKALKMPVMLVYGDSDMYRPEHIVQFYQLLGGGLHDAGWGREHMSRNRLAILPNATHYDVFLSPMLAPTILPFLDGKSDTSNWADQVTAK